jgi:hypothetical protein
MNEPRTIDVASPRRDEPLSTAELVNRQSQAQSRGDLPAESADGERPEPLFPGTDTEDFRSRWHIIQAAFVDEPRRAVEQADQLVASVVQRVAEIFASERGRLEHDWSQGQDASTEDLRQSLRRYRSFFDRLLSV